MIIRSANPMPPDPADSVMVTMANAQSLFDQALEGDGDPGHEVQKLVSKKSPKRVLAKM